MDHRPPASTADPGAEPAGDARPREGEGLELAALEVGGGAAAGAVIGRILGGGARAALIGAVVGAAAGTALSLGTRLGSAGPRPVGASREAARRPTRGPRRREEREEEPTPSAEAPRERLESWTKARLYEVARELEIAGRSKMNKAELIRALRRHPDFAAV